MNRREFTTSLGMGAVALSLGGIKLSGALPVVEDQPHIAITMDDFLWNRSVRLTPDERNQAILGALRSHDLKAALFVQGKNADNAKGKRLLSEWDRAGHLIGNHTYSHMELNSSEVTSEMFTADILKCEAILKSFPRFQKRFRFPYLKEGETAIKRDAVRAFLRQHGYSIGHVTIDASDWAVENRLSARLTK